MSSLSKKRYCEMLDELVSDSCRCEYCFLKTFLSSLHPEPRVLVQIKCMEKFKYEKSSERGTDIGWNEAADLWCNEGWAEAFSIVFDEELPFRTIYENCRKMISQRFRK